MMGFVDLQPGSPGHRVGLYLASNPGVQMTRTDLAMMLQLAPGAVDRALLPAMEQGVITAANDGHDGRVWRGGPRIASWVASLKEPPPAPATRLVGATTAPKRAGKPRGHLPPLDMGALRLVTNAPPPPNRITRQGHTRYEALLAKLTEDGMAITGIPICYRGALTKSINVFLKARPALAARSAIVMRTINDQTVGLWRMPKDQADAMAAGPRKARTSKTTATATA